MKNNKPIVFRLFILIFFGLFICSTACSQEYGYKNFTVADGLPSSMVYCMSKDKKGRIWLGTQNGVSIFNGNTFKNLTREDGLIETEIFILFHDSKDRAWFCPFGNSILYYDNNKIKSISEPAGFGSLLLTYKRNIFEDREGNIWYLGRDAIRIEDDTIIRIVSGNKYNCYDHLYDKNGQINLVTEYGIRRVSNDTLSFDTILLKKNAPTFRGICRMDNGYYFFSTKRIFYFRFDDTGEVLENKDYVFPYDINRIISLDGKNIWVLSEGNGAFFIDSDKQDTTLFLPNNSVSDVLMDNDSNYWFSTIDKGIFKINRSMTRIFNKQSGLASDEINTVTADHSKTIWVGTSKGYVNLVKDLKISEKSFGNDEGYNRILDIKSDIHGNVYVASDNGLYYYNLSKPDIIKKMDLYRAFKCIYPYSDSVIYAGSAASFYRIKKENLTVTKEWTGRTTAITGFGTGKLLIGNLNGMYFGCDDSAGIFQLPGYELDEKINYIVSDKDNKVWAATHSAGVFVFDGIHKVNFTTKNGLLSNACRHIFIDSTTNDVWISTNQGLNKIEIHGKDRNNYQISGFTMDDGLPSNEINQACVVDNVVWIATTNGLAMMQNKDRLPEQVPSVFITQIKVNDSIYMNPGIIDLPYWNNSLNILVEGISFSAGKRISYKYRLKGLEYKWTHTSDNNFTYQPLPPGDYELEVVAVHPHIGIESLPVSCKIKIHAPFWKEGWFITLVALFTVCFIFLVYLRRLKVVRKKSELKNHLLQLEITAIRAQMNPHFIFNSLNSIQDFIFKNQKELANDYLSSFSGLMRMVLDNSMSNFIALNKEIEFLKLYLKLEQLRLNHKFDYEIKVDPGMNLWSAYIPTMILQPLLENAIIHGIRKKNGKGTIVVNFSDSDNVITCTVEDDGAGRNNTGYPDSSNPIDHKPFGIHAINERIKILNHMQQIQIKMTLEDLKDESQNPAGTRVELKIIPLTKS